jgi:hypothetical protein
MRAAKRRLEQDIATPGLSLLLAAYYDPAGGFAGATFDTLGANPRNEITRDDLLAVAVLDVRWRPAAVRRLLGADSRKATDLLVGISSLTDLWLASDQRLAAIGPLLCWLALLLARIAENACGDTWPDLRRELDRIHAGTFTGPAGTFRQRTELTKAQRDILRQLKIDPPPRIYQLTPVLKP